MPSEYDNDLLREGLLHIRVKEYDLARPFLERALESADDLQTRANASYWLSVITADPAEKRRLLEDTLAIDPTYPEARRALAVLDGKLKPEAIVDPEAPQAPAPGTAEVPAERFTCPKCGGRMVYAADGRSLVCESCQRTEQLGTGAPAAQQDFFIAMADGLGQRQPVSVVTFQCEGCGARFLLAPQELSATCAYCGSNHVVATRERRDLLAPDAILPMAFEQRQATRQLVRWVEARKIRPQGKVREPGGLYLPVWTFDILGNIPWKGLAHAWGGEGTALRGTISLAASREQLQPVSGEYPVQFDHVCVTGSRKLADLLVRTMAEFDFPGASAYDPRFLSGWPAEIYEISMADASLEARKIAVGQVHRVLSSHLAGVQNPIYSPSNIMVTGFKLVLVPVWVTEYAVESRTYRVLINGQTGSVVGEAPQRGLAVWVSKLLDGSQS